MSAQPTLESVRRLNTAGFCAFESREGYNCTLTRGHDGAHAAMVLKRHPSTREFWHDDGAHYSLEPSLARARTRPAGANRRAGVLQKL